MVGTIIFCEFSSISISVVSFLERLLNDSSKTANDLRAASCSDRVGLAVWVSTAGMASVFGDAKLNAINETMLR